MGRVTESARDAGGDVTEGVWEDAFHAWQAFALMLPEGRAAIERIGVRIRASGSTEQALRGIVRVVLCIGTVYLLTLHNLDSYCA